MRNRQKILDNLESLYREAFARAREADDAEGMARLDFEFQREQLQLEILLDLRDLLAAMDTATEEEGKTTSLLEKAQALRKLTKLRP